jgi:type I restriction enzyme S subunit
MGLTKLGTLIELVEFRNSNLTYGEEDVCGVSNNKEIMTTKANNEGRDLSNFYIVKPNEFIYNSRTTRMGEKVGLGYNNSEATIITSFNNTAFKIKNEAKSVLLPMYLYIYYNRPEFDRYARFNSWGSSTELFSWSDMCDIEIDLPPLPVQERFVAVYNSMLANQCAYESGLLDLKLTCDAYLEKLQREIPHKAIGEYIKQSDERNRQNLSVDSVRGLSTSKEIIPTKANLDGVSLNNYKIMKPGQIAYVADTSRRGDKISLAYNNTEETYLVSSISTVFSTMADKLLPAYLKMFFSRSEFDRYARFHSWGSAREAFGWEDMSDVKIPIPDISVQKSIVDIYTAYLKRREINEKLKAQIKDICPILIKGSLEEASA